MHTITNNEVLGFIEVKIKGWCTLDEFHQFTADLRTAIRAFPHRGQQPASLYDFTDASIQTQAVVAAMKALAVHPALSHRRVALYTEGLLARLQAKRISETRPNIRVFDSRAEAVAWLTAADEIPQTSDLAGDLARAAAR